MVSVDDEWSAVDCGFEALDFDYTLPVSVLVPDDVVIHNPGVPFLHNLKQRLIAGSNFIIDGAIYDNAIKFSVDLCAHVMCPRDNVVKKHIALHLNPRLPMNCVVRNSFIDNTWGQEEIKTFRRNPLKRGLEFVLEVFVSPAEYLIAVNGGHFCTFAHRLPYDKITSIEINGDITLKKVTLMNSKIYPTIPVDPVSTQGFLELPLVKKLPQSLSITTTIIVEGTVYLLPFTCYFNLQSGSQIYPHPLIPLHMSLRWQPSEGDVIVFNSWTNDKWDTELELPMCNLFQPGSDFVMRIKINDNGFQAIVNDFPLPVFPHRMKYELVDTLVVQGDIKLTRADIIR
uniref:Galectin n=1 Tax=Lygus hesperus TaxID=30085 RepID=A0A0A9XUI5_LYGHE